MSDDQKLVSTVEFRAGLAEQKTELLSSMTAQKTELLSAMAEQKTELESFMRQIETNVLTAFHGYARGAALDVGDQDIRLRLGVLEERVLSLETRRPS